MKKKVENGMNYVMQTVVSEAGASSEFAMSTIQLNNRA